MGSGKGEFGYSVAISSDDSTAAIGSPHAEEGKGSVETYKREGSKWAEFRGLDTCEERVFPPGNCTKRLEEQEEGLYGSSVALSADGSNVLVGMPKNEAGAFFYALAVESLKEEFLYYFQDGPKKTPPPSQLAAFDLGVALSGDGSTALLGGPLAANGRFAVSVLTRSGYIWSEQAELSAAEAEQIEENAGGEFGHSVALSADGNTALIGAPGELDPVLKREEAGSAWEFKRTGSAWSQSGGKLLGGGEESGLKPNYGSEF